MPLISMLILYLAALLSSLTILEIVSVLFCFWMLLDHYVSCKQRFIYVFSSCMSFISFCLFVLPKASGTVLNTRS